MKPNAQRDAKPDRTANRETFMRRFSLTTTAARAAMITGILASVITAPAARAQDAAALSGQVTSAEEGAMEGVIVSAKKDGTNITVSVVTNPQGRYSFPAGRLASGHYALSTRAAGYDLEGPDAADVAAGNPATVDLKLRKTRNLSKQLTNAEWMMSMPGSDDDKLQLLNCVSCHTLERIVKSTHDADEFVQVVTRMQGYAQVSQPIKPQRRVDQSRAANPERFRKFAQYLASINLSQVPRWEYALKTLPRVTGRSTHVVITEYDLPRPTIEPHDVVFAGGYAWYTNFGEEYIGRLDPKTGQHKEFALPELKQGFPTGSLDLKLDRDGPMWFGMMYQGALAKFDPGTEKFQIFPVAPERNKDDTQLNMLTMNYGIDGKMWTNDAGPSTILRLDLASGKYENFDPLALLPGGRANKSIYDIAADSSNNLYMTEFQNNYIVRLDAKTGAVTYYQAPTALARNRRGNMDAQDRFWFAEYRGNKIGMFDTKQERFSEWALPTPFTQPYDVTFDRNGELWTGGMTTDRVVRLDPKTGQGIEYPLARDTNMRHMFVDNTTSPVTFWVGSNHGASIVKVEPQD
jgi:virginiamycin B lyase